MSSKISLGLKRISGLLQKLNNPHRKYDTVHVAGTNGKGSVSAMIANTLSMAGLSTGLYTSPHLAHRWDVISIDGQTIPKEAFLSLERELRSVATSVESSSSSSLTSNDAEEKLTTFEMMTALAFETFRREQVDVAVIEVGLGGREDATNVLQPLVSVITAIGIDHTAILGHSIKEITMAKAGIIRPGVPVVASSDQEFGQVFGILGQAQREINGSHKITWTPPNSTLDFRISNRNTARTVLQGLRGRTLSNGKLIDASVLTDDLIEEGIRTANWRGRCSQLDLTLLGGAKDTIVDGAHNAQSIEALASILNNNDSAEASPRTFIIAMTAGKDPTYFKKLLRPNDKFLSVEFEAVHDMAWIAPMASSEILDRLSQDLSKSIIGRDYGADLGQAIRESGKSSGQVVVCGSLYMVGQLYRVLERAKYEHGFQASQVQPDGSVGPYNPARVEQRVRQYWHDLPPENPSAKKPLQSQKMDFLLPPPNVTGSLHIGHALTIAIQDGYARYYRMTGHEVKWVPGVDHAGIATQSVVSKHLQKSGIKSGELPKEQFLSEIWKWRQQFGARITSQIKSLGASLTWEDEYFTMDQKRSTAVVEAFCQLWNAGLIRREKKMVNWSIGLQSVISDIEVVPQSIDGPTMIDGVQFGMMWRIRYLLVNETQDDTSQHYIEVDTTRPETVFGDRAIAVHPSDSRYANFIGREVHHPLLSDIRLSIVADSSVSSKFGTGCVKVTPAHDIDDYEISLRHKSIPIIPVFDKFGTMIPIDAYPQLHGMDRLRARKEVVAILRGTGALVSSQPHKTTINLCSRTSSVIEPMLLPQWYVKMAPLAKEVLSKDDIRMTSKSQNEWTRWLTNVQDWCISRQLVWGHQIPLYRVIEEKDGASERWVFGKDKEDAMQEALRTGHAEDVVQDTDVLDTWFSAGLLPLSAFDWPEKNLHQGHKLEFIESGPDIIFFWLARMAMLCTFLTGNSPFKEIVLHPLIRDSRGRKMSKSLGNVIDPLSIIEGRSLTSMLEGLKMGNIDSSEMALAEKELKKTYPKGIEPAGSDALRFALIQSTTQAEALKFDMRTVVAGRYLCTKLWNAVNFYRFSVQERSGDLQVGSQSSSIILEASLLDQWLLSSIQDVDATYHRAFADRSLAVATERLRSFFIDDFCDVYLEFVKVELRTLLTPEARVERLSLFKTVLETVLKMMAPFMPYITEDLWHLLNNSSSIHDCQSFTRTENDAVSPEIVRQRFDSILDVLKVLRTLDRPKSLDVVIHLSSAESCLKEDFENYCPHLERLASVKSLLVLSSTPPADHHVVVVSPIVSLSHPQSAAESPSAGLTAAQMRDQVKLQQLTALLNDEVYQLRVPEKVKHKHHEQMEELKARLQGLEKMS